MGAALRRRTGPLGPLGVAGGMSGGIVGIVPRCLVGWWMDDPMDAAEGS
jgi:hypothetical protein